MFRNAIKSEIFDRVLNLILIANSIVIIVESETTSRNANNEDTSIENNIKHNRYGWFVFYYFVFNWNGDKNNCLWQSSILERIQVRWIYKNNNKNK